jgi:N-methylhydantoinase A
METPVQLVTLRVEATGGMPVPVMPWLASMLPPMPNETRPVHFLSRTVDAPVTAREKLGAGTTLDGPAIVTQLDATTLVPAGWHLDVHKSGSMLLTRR